MGVYLDTIEKVFGWTKTKSPSDIHPIVSCPTYRTWKNQPTLPMTKERAIELRRAMDSPRCDKTDGWMMRCKEALDYIIAN